MYIEVYVYYIQMLRIFLKIDSRWNKIIFDFINVHSLILATFFSVPREREQTLRSVNIGPKLSLIKDINACSLFPEPILQTEGFFFHVLSVCFSEMVMVGQDLDRQQQMRFAWRQHLQPTAPQKVLRTPCS